MSYTLGIRIDGCRIKDRDAKFIALIIYSLTYEEIHQVLGYAEKTVRNCVSDLYGLLDVPNQKGLIRIARLHGFGLGGTVYGRDILEPYERKCLLAKVPRLNYEKELSLTSV